VAVATLPTSSAFETVRCFAMHFPPEVLM